MSEELKFMGTSLKLPARWRFRTRRRHNKATSSNRKGEETIHHSNLVTALPLEFVTALPLESCQG